MSGPKPVKAGKGQVPSFAFLEEKANESTQGGKDYTEFIKLFNGLYNVSGGIEGAERALAFLKEGNADLKIQVCIVVTSKPTSLLFEGASRNMLNRGKKAVTPIDQSLSQYLPRFSKLEIDSMEDSKKALMSRKRSSWPEAFKTVNVTQCRRIAFAAFVYCPADSKIPVLTQWRSKYKNIDEAGNLMTGQTRAIFEDQAVKFRSTQNLIESTGLAKFIASPLPP